MKHQTVKKRVAAALGIIPILAVVALSSCRSNGDILPVVNTAFLNFVNADTASINIFQNGSRLNQVSTTASGSQTGYLTVAAGKQTFQLKKNGGINYIVDGYQLTLDSGQSYSLFAGGETADKLFLVTDAGNVIDTLANVRFINASPSTANLTVTLRDSLSFTNRAFKSATGLAYISGGVSTLKVYQAGASTPLLTSNVTLTAGYIYTIFTKGVIGGTGQNALAVKLLLNQ